MPLGVSDFNPYMSEEETKSYIEKWFPEETSMTVGKETKYFKTEKYRVPGSESEKRERMARPTWLLKIMELDKPGGRLLAKEALYQRIGTGPKIRGQENKAVVTLESSTGSPYVGLIGREIYQQEETPSFGRGTIEARFDPMENASRYFYGSFFVNKQKASRQQGKLSELLAKGSEEMQLAGGSMTVAEHLLSDYAFYSTAQRVSQGFGRKVEDREKAIGSVAKWIHGDVPPAMSGGAMRQLAGMVPYVDSDGITRWREASQTKPQVVRGQYQFDMFGGPKALRKLNVARGERERLTDYFYKRNEQTGRLKQAYAEPITERGQEGLRLLNVKWGPGKAESAIVTRGTYMVPGTPESGAATLYEGDPREAQGIVGPFFPTRETKEVSAIDYLALKNETEYQWGIFEKQGYTDEEGNKAFRYIPKIDPETGEQIPLEGYTLGRGESAIIGMKKTYNRLTGEVTETPERLSAGPRITTIRGNPKLVLPGYYDPEELRFAAAPGRAPEAEFAGEAIPIPEEDKEAFAKMMGGGAVEYTGLQGIHLSVPIGTEQNIGRKQGGLKEALSQAYELVGGEKPQRRVETLGGEVDVRSITGEVKNPLAQFRTGTFGTMMRPQMTSLISDLYAGETRERMLGVINKVFDEQEILQRQVKEGKLTKAEYREMHPAVDLEDLSQIYRETVPGKENVETWRFMEEMYRDFNILARTSPKHVLENYDYALVDKPQPFPYKKIHKSWQPYLEATLGEAVNIAQSESKGGISQSLADEIKQGYYRFTETENPDYLMWEIMEAGRWGTTAGGVVTEHMNRETPGLGSEGMTALQTEYSDLAAIYMGIEENLMTPGQKAWRAIDQWYTYQSSSLGIGDTSLPPGYHDKDYTPISAEQASQISAGFKQLAPEEMNYENWQRVIEEAVGGPTKDILRMQFGTRPSILAPRTASAAAEYDIDEYGRRLDKSAIAFHYPDALSELMVGGDYEKSRSAKKLMGHLGSVLETSRERAKQIKKTPVLGVGGKLGTIAGQLPVGYSLIGEDAMRNAVSSMAKALNYPTVRGGRVSERFVNKAMQRIEERGYLGQLLSSDPSYLRTNSLIASKTITPKMARQQLGLDVPEQLSFKEGKALMGGLGTLGSPVLAGFEVHSIGKDFDLDELRRILAEETPLYESLNWWQKTLYDFNREKEGRPLMELTDKFMEQVSETGAQFTERQRKMFANMSDQPLGGKFNPLVGEIAESILTINNPRELREFQEKTGYERNVTQPMLMKGATWTRAGFNEMGTGFNIRRLIEGSIQASESTGQFSKEDIAEMYGDVSTSYKEALEVGKSDPIPRSIEKVIGSIHPFVRGKYKVDDPGFGSVGSYVGIGGYIDRGGGKDVYWESPSLDFSEDTLYTNMAEAALSDIGKGLITKRGAVGLFAGSGEERQELIGRLEQGETPTDILFGKSGRGLLTKKGYDFSRSVWGKTMQAQFEDKLKGVSKAPYTFPKSSQYYPETALSVIGDLPMVVGGQEYPVKEGPQETMVAAILQQYQTGRGGFISAKQRALLEDYALGLEKAGGEVSPILQHARGKLKTGLAYDILSMTNVANRQMHYEGEYKLSPHSVERAKEEAREAEVWAQTDPRLHMSLKEREDLVKQTQKQIGVLESQLGAPAPEGVVGAEPAIIDESTIKREIEQKQRTIDFYQVTDEERQQATIPPTQTGAGGSGKKPPTTPPSVSASPIPEEPNRGGRPRFRPYSSGGTRGRNIPAGSIGDVGSGNPVINNLRNAEPPEGEESWLQYLNRVPVKEGNQMLYETFTKPLIEAQEGGRSYTSGGKYQDILIGNYNRGVAAYEEYRATIENVADVMPQQLATSLEQRILKEGATPEFQRTEEGWVDAEGNLIQVGQVIGPLRAHLKSLNIGSYEEAVGERREIAGQAMKLHKQMSLAVQAAPLIKSHNAEALIPGATKAMEDLLYERGRFDLFQQLEGEKKPKKEYIRNDEAILDDTIKRFSDLKDVIKDLPDKLKTLGENIDKSSKSMEGWTDQQKIAIDDLKEKRSEIESAVQTVQTTARRLEEGGISKEQAAGFAQEGLRGIKKSLQGRALLEEIGENYPEQIASGEAFKEPEVTKLGAFSKSLRGIFGGWGMMYMGRLASMGTNIWKNQYAEAEQYQMQALQAARERYGAGFGEGISPLAYEQQAARIRGGGGVYGDIARGMTWVDENADITSPIMGGLGAGLLTHWALPTMVPALGEATIGSGILAGASAVLPAAAIAAGVVGTGLYAWNQVENYKEYDETIASAAALGAMGKGGAARRKTFGIDVWERLQDPYGRKGEGAIREEEHTELVQKIASGMTVGELKELEKEMGEEEFFWLTNSFGQYSTGAFGQLQSSTKQVTLYGALEATDNSIRVSDFVLQSGLDIESGGVGIQMAAQVHSLTGQFPTKGALQQTGMLISALPAEQQQKVSATLDLLQRTPGAKAEFYNMEKERFLQIAGGIKSYEDAVAKRNKAISQGMPEYAVPEPELDERAGLYADIATKGYEEYFLQYRSVREALRQKGVEWNIDEERFRERGWTQKEEDQFREELTYRATQEKLIDQFEQMGMPVAGAREMVQGAQGMAGLEFMQRLQSLEPRAYGQLYQLEMQAGNIEGAQSLYPVARMANYNIATGMPTTQGMFRTSLAGPNAGGFINAMNSAVTNAGNIFSGNWQQSQTALAATYGINVATGERYGPENQATRAQWASGAVVGGEQGFQVSSIYKSYENAMAGIGTSYAQIALQEEYMPKFWDIQDRQRELAHRQQTWQFEQQEWQLGFSERQMEMGARQWQEQFGLQQKQAYMQRQWTQEDWGYQDLTRSLQWGWKQEDYAENIRFMTGRQRRLAERSMERETTMYNLETGQIDTQRERQKEIWALQDERFDMEASHHKEQLAMQEESLEKQREQLEMQKQFYEERRQLEEESIQLSREYQTKQLELQKAALGVQAQQIEAQKDQALRQFEINAEQEEAMDTYKQLQQETTQFFTDMIDGIKLVGDNWSNMIQSIIDNTEFTPTYPDKGGGGGGGGGDNNPEQRAGGGDMFSGMSYLVGERGPELVRPGRISSVVSQYDIAEAMGQSDKWASRSVFHPTQGGVSGMGGGGTTIVNVHVGNEKLASFILNTVKNDLEVI